MIRLIGHSSSACSSRLSRCRGLRQRCLHRGQPSLSRGATGESVFHKHPKHLALASDGAFGKFDKAQLQRGYQVYKEVCSACHSLKYVAFRNLAELGYDESQVKAEAASWQVPGIDPNTGEATTRAGLPTDYFPSPYPNDVAARAANNNAVPPDLSLITKARHDGAAYVYSLLTGYQNQPAALVQAVPRYEDARRACIYNPYFANLNLAMAPPLTADGQVTFADGSPSDCRSHGAGRCRFPHLDGRTDARKAQANRLAGAGLPAVRHDSCLSRVPEYLGRQEI